MIAPVLLSLTAALAGPGPGSTEPPCGPPPPLPHAVAFVNDSRSHGLVGDQFLSLNEVIQLHNRTLTFAQLSTPEQWQISGAGQDVAWADIDGSSTPVITIERNLDPIIDFPHGLLIAGVNDRPVLDFTGAGVTTGFVSGSNFVSWRELIVQGGTVGIELTQTDAIQGTVIDGVDFTGQSVAAVRCTLASPNQNGRVLFTRCTFANAPTAIQLNDTGPGRTAQFYVGDSTMSNVGTGIDVVLGPGGSGRYLLERLVVAASVVGVRFQRPGAAATRAMLLEATHLRVAAPLPCAIAGVAGGPSGVTLRMLDLTRTAGSGPALDLGALGGQITGDVDELKAVGGVNVLTGGTTGALHLLNARVSGGAVTVGSSGGVTIDLRDSRFDLVALGTTGGLPVVAAGCCLVGGSAQGSAAAPLSFTACHLGANLGPHVTASGTLASPQIGSSAIVPAQPLLGGPLTLQADLPPGFLGIWAMGPTAYFPTIQPPPIHIYMEPSGIVTLPGIYRLQQGLTFGIPNHPGLVGTDWTGQLLVLPDPGVPGPPLALPPGGRFALR